MDERDFALKVIARLNSPITPTTGRRPYTLPEPTIEDIVVWLEYQQIYYWLGVVERYAAMPDYQHMSAWENTRKHCEELAGITEKLLEEGAISQEQYERIKAARPYATEGEKLVYVSNSDQREAMLTQIQRWRPSAHGATTHHGKRCPVYVATSAEGQEIYLTFEDGQWYRHDGYPYPYWSPEH